MLFVINHNTTLLPRVLLVLLLVLLLLHCFWIVFELLAQHTITTLFNTAHLLWSNLIIIVKKLKKQSLVNFSTYQIFNHWMGQYLRKIEKNGVYWNLRISQKAYKYIIVSHIPSYLNFIQGIYWASSCFLIMNVEGAIGIDRSCQIKKLHWMKKQNISTASL